MQQNYTIIKKLIYLFGYLLLNHSVILAQTDVDYDGMDDAWEIANQLNPSDPTDAWCDCDNDQILNLFEFQLQTNPNDFASPPIRYFTPQNTQEEFAQLMNSGLNDLAVIRMSEGTYNLYYDTSNSGGLINSSNYKIMIQGGWNNDFTEYNPFEYSTIFDGEGTPNILVLATSENRQVTFILDGVELTNSGNYEREGAVKCINTAGTGKFSFYNCSFYNNGYNATDSGFALSIDWLDEMSNGDFFLVNTSIVNNRNGLWGQISPTTFGRWRIYNSTITNSTQTTIFEVEASSQTPNAIAIDVLNSIIWEGDIDDPIFFHAAENTEMNIAYSNISEINNDDNLLEVNSLTTSVTNIDTEFINETGNHFELQAQSPLKEAGYIIGLPFEGSLPDIGVNQKVYNPLKVDTIITQPTCLGNDGSIAIVPLDGIGGLTFSLDDVDYQTDSIFNNLDVGNYTLYIKGNQTCQKRQISFLLEEVAQQFRAEMATFCKGERYTLPDGAVVNEPGVYNSTVTNNLNCSVNIETTLTELISYEIISYVDICAGETYTLIDGREVSQSRSYSTNLQTVIGCDSTLIVNLTVNDSPIIENTIDFCNIAGASYTLEDGTVVTNSDTYTVEIINGVTGCTETYITEINFTNIIETTQDVFICEGEIYTLPDGTEVTAAATYESTFQSAQGCDSIVFTNLAYIVIEEIISEQINICEGEMHTLPDGTIAVAQDTYITTVTSQFGCVKRYITTLTVNEVDIIIDYPLICRGETFELPDGRVVSEAGTYESDFTSIYGCDSLVNKVLSVYSPTEDKEISICEGETYNLEDGRTIFEAGTYTFELVSETGCITTYNTILNIDEVYRVAEDVIICDDDTYTLPDGSVVDNNGIYESMLQSFQGCDSIVTTSLSINSTQTIEKEVDICEGDMHTLEDGSQVAEAGVFTVSVTDVSSGCFATYQTTVSINATSESTQDINICEGEIYILPNGVEVDANGMYESILQNIAGCDSIITTNLTIRETVTTSDVVSICEGQTYTLPDGIVISEAGTYESILQSPAGCDNIITTDLTINQTLTALNDVSICDGEIYTLPDAIDVNETGVYESIVPSTQGCDSIITTNLSINPSPTVQNNISICEGFTYTLEDNSIVSTAGIYTVNITDDLTGCITSYITSININNTFETIRNTEICEGESYTLPDGIVVNLAGMYESTLQTIVGCDSIITTNLSFSQKLTGSNEVNICNGESYTLPDGMNVSDAGMYESTLPSVAGCDSVVTTNLVISQTLTGSNEVNICNGETYTLPDGIDVSDAGTYESILPSIAGCDSIITTNLTISEPLTALNEVNICNGETYTLPNGIDVTDAGIYESTLQSTQGCDSIIQTNVTTVVIDIDMAEEFTLLLDAVELTNTIQSTNPVQYSWSPPNGLSCTDCQQPLAIVTEKSDYFLEVTDTLSDCKANATVQVVKRKIKPAVPTAFSPNNDGINDYLIPMNINADVAFLFVVFNRWGQKLFETNSLDTPWDGSFKNYQQQIGVYIWYFQYQLPNENIKQMKGNVTLVR